jgi:hypothetical protein
MVFEFPPSAFIKSFVRIESLYGTLVVESLDFADKAAIHDPLF